MRRIGSGPTAELKRKNQELQELSVRLESLATRMADKLLERGIYVVGFSYPVVPQGQARIRVQVSAAHTDGQLDRALAAFTETGKELGVI